ncbi:hypothetical protein [Nonomuraea sp. KM90]|uniref:hypothetical protein n=1 Tax=Nonomuraea sp. KM90 TaxID=3457428 RepID=UPI003FCCCC34
MKIDHVVLAARTPEQAEQTLPEHGLGIARGRVPHGFGLSNLVGPLGQSSLEIHYPNGGEVDPALPPIGEARPRALDRVPWPVPHEERPHGPAAPHARRPAGIAGLDAAEAAESVTHWCGGLPEGVRVVEGDTSPLRVRVGFDDGSRGHAGRR